MSEKHLSRRRVVAGAAWTAPAIVVASAVPAYALSGPANVLITFGPTSRTGDQLSVDMEWVNRNTEPTGLMTTAVYFTPTIGFGTIPKLDPVIDAGASTPGWTFVGSNNNEADRSFSFTRAAPGIPGAPDALGVSDPVVLSFTITVTPNVATLSAGQIRTLSVVSSGSMGQANSAWV
jgi:hypothetical protein